VLDALLPLACPGCGADAAAGAPVCAGCAARFRAAPLVPPPAGVDAWAAPFSYADVARELVARVKYRNTRAVVPWLAVAMAHVVADGALLAGAVDADPVATWAPTTASRRRARGFDPAEILARSLARRLGLRAARLLDRGAGPPQTGLDAAARRAGPKFVARGSSPVHVLLVDDVATTGATLAAAAHALRGAGAIRVVAVTAARTPAPGTA
jgi:predicted amidophosphoribosyltransferase